MRKLAVKNEKNPERESLFWHIYDELPPAEERAVLLRKAFIIKVQLEKQSTAFGHSVIRGSGYICRQANGSAVSSVF